MFFIFFLLVRLFVFIPFKVIGPSMCDTLNVFSSQCASEDSPVGEFVILDRFSYFFTPPKRGDVIVANFDIDSRHTVKRIIGLPGEMIEIKDDGYVYIVQEDSTTVKLDEEVYLNEDSLGHTLPSRMTSFEIPVGSYLVLGDNRQESIDSRHCFVVQGNGDNCLFSLLGPYVERQDIMGKVRFVIWPPSHMRFVH